MTPAQDQQFIAHGCACRCLLWLANNRHTRAITREQFIDEFSITYPVWAVQNNCGATNTGMIVEIADALNLPHSLQVYRSPQLVKDDVKQNRTNTILLITEKQQSKNPATPHQWDFVNHCRIVVPQWADAQWQVTEVDDSISLYNPLGIKDSELESWSAYFCVFYG